ncbi:U4/U6.U5 snRNP associated protein [Coemansia sp. Benny D115]|nr:U4/U6.U5 snRNP associated protein [Coemansia sp. Benny D115]
MSSQNAYGGQKKADSFRRNWDTAAYEQKAKDRQKQAKQQEENDERRRKGLKPLHTQQPTSFAEKELLKARTHAMDLEAMVGKTQVVQVTSAASGQAGFYCKVCDVTVKDSLTYLDHINGKNHQRMLNRSMKVATETVEDVLKKLKSLRDAKKRKEKMEGTTYDFYGQVRMQQQKNKEAKARRKEAHKASKDKQRKTTEGDMPDTVDHGSQDTGVDDEMSAMMGFGSFGSSKKR